MMATGRGIIFDGDDTLWEIQGFYDEAKDAFYDLMESQGFDRQVVRSEFVKIDKANFADYGYSKYRFPQSMEDTYLYLCRNNNRAAVPSILRQTGVIGAKVFKRKPILRPGAREILIELRRTHSIVLFSVGDVDIQREKVYELSLEPLFDASYITTQKGIAQLQRILEEQQLSAQSTWMVGNSVRSDINPALALGLRAIWVEVNSWDYEQEEMGLGEVWSVNQLSEIPQTISRVEAADARAI